MVDKTALILFYF